jgi:XTP/dITP diphosphohydrolase
MFGPNHHSTIINSMTPGNNTTEQKLEQFGRLLRIMDELREQCPWDRKQTLESLRHLTIEETFELADAIADGNLDEIRKEIGDIMLHMVFYARIGSEKGAFDIADVIDSLCEKLIHRHPHIYGDPANAGQVVKVANEEEVKQNWEKLKLKEGSKSVLSGVPRSLPAMTKATRIQDKARGVGFDWERPEQVWDKVNEELSELKAEVDTNADPDRIADELGDVIFSLINYARFLDIDPELALERTNRKFIKRFQYLEEGAQRDGRKLQDMTLEEMDEYWNRAKAEN